MLSILLALTLSAEETLPPIVIEATRLEDTAQSTPSAVRVLGEREISAVGAENVVDLVARAVPSVHLHRLGGANPALSEISLRGYGENGHGRTLVLVDGERLNSPDQNMPDLSRISLGGLRRLEILYGPQCVLYGDGASAGVINVVTEPDSDERKSYVSLGAASFDTFSAALGTRGGFADEGVKYWADGSWTQSAGERFNSEYELLNILGGLKKSFENGSSLKLQAFHSEADYHLPGAENATPLPDDRFRRQTTGVSSALVLPVDDELELKISANLSKRKMHGYQRGSGWFSDNHYDILSYRVRAELNCEKALFGHENEFLFGLEGVGDFLDGTQMNSSGRQLPTYDRNTAAAFALERFHFDDAFALEAGFRYAHAWSHNSLCTRARRENDLTASHLALLYTPTDDLKFYLKGASFYRMPFLDEVPGRFDAGYNWVNTKLLKPERGVSAELGGSYEVASGWHIAADAYVSRLVNEIFYNSLVYNNENARSPTLRTGADAEIGWTREKVASVTAAASYVHARFLEGEFRNERLPLVPELTLSLNARVWLFEDFSLLGGVRHQTETTTASDFHNDFERMDAYALFHVGAKYEPTFCEALRGISILFLVDNLFDTSYSNYATYGRAFYPGAGRTYSLNVKYEF